MQLCDLPEDILVIVLGFCLLNDDKLQNLKLDLPLLAVCRQWRCLAIPLVYSRAYFQYGDIPTCRHYQHDEARASGEPADIPVKTNLDLIAAVGVASVVKSANIDIYYSTNPFPGWRDVICRMRAMTSKWRVVLLKVAMHPALVLIGIPHAVDITMFTDDIAEVSDALAALMPDVRRLECGGLNGNPIARSLYGRLAGHYTDQLQRLRSKHPITVPVDRPFTRLQSVTINFDHESDYQLPRMASKELVDVAMGGGLASHSWEPFSTNSDLRVIEFTRLKRLHAYYDLFHHEGAVAVRHQDEEPWELRFPSLTMLDVNSTQSKCPLLHYAVLPASIEAIHISMNAAAYESIADVMLPTSKRLMLGVKSLSEDPSRGFAAINGLLKRVRRCEVVKLLVSDRTRPVPLENITCTTLMHLAISGPTSVDSMLSFIERMPNLAKLVFDRLDTHNIQSDVSIPGADENAVIEPLSTLLRLLAIDYHRDGYSPDMAVAVAKHVLLRIPTLAELLIAQTPKEPVLGFVEAYAPRYPRLRSVEFNICEGEATMEFQRSAYRHH